MNEFVHDLFVLVPPRGGNDIVSVLARPQANYLGQQKGQFFKRSVVE